MSNQQTYAGVNDYEVSWSDIATTLRIPNAQPLPDLDWAGVKFSRKVELGERKGPSGGRTTARTTGTGSCEASGSIYRSSNRVLYTALAAVAPKRGNQARISLVSFDLVVQHTLVGSDLVFTTNIKGCRITGDSDDMKEGNDADKIELTLNPIEVVTILPDGTEVVLI